MKKVKIRANVDYEDRVTKGKVYSGFPDPFSMHFTCDLGMNTTVSISSCGKNGSWFEIINELPKNIKVL